MKNGYQRMRWGFRLFRTFYCLLRMLQWHQRKGTTICDFSVFGKLHISRSQQNDSPPFSKASTLEGVSEKLPFIFTYTSPHFRSFKRGRSAKYPGCQRLFLRCFRSQLVFSIVTRVILSLCRPLADAARSPADFARR